MHIVDLERADSENFKNSWAALERSYPGCQLMTEMTADLLTIIGQRFARVSRIGGGEAVVNHWLSSMGSKDGQLLNFLESATLIGEPSEEDITERAREGYLDASADLARVWLLLRIRRDYLLGLVEIFRLRFIPCLGYLRLQSETASLVSLFSSDSGMAREWTAVIREGGKQFYKKHQKKIRDEIRELGLDEYYREGSEKALHSYPFGIGLGISSCYMDEERSVSLSYQELGGEVRAIHNSFSYYIRAQHRIASGLRRALPELGGDTDLDSRQQEIKQHASRVLRE